MVLLFTPISFDYSPLVIMAPNSSSTGQQSPGSGFGLKDILYVVFGHKWKILFFSLLGLAGAAVMFVKQTPVYESQADLLVKYLFAHSNVDNWKLE